MHINMQNYSQAVKRNIGIALFEMIKIILFFFSLSPCYSWTKNKRSQSKCCIEIHWEKIKLLYYLLGKITILRAAIKRQIFNIIHPLKIAPIVPKFKSLSGYCSFVLNM